MNTKELRELSVDDLSLRTRELRKEIIHARVQQAAGQLENTARLNVLRKDIARLETVLSERRIATAAAAPKPVKQPKPAPAPAAAPKKKAAAPAAAAAAAEPAKKAVAPKKRAAIKKAKPTDE